MITPKMITSQEKAVKGELTAFPILRDINDGGVKAPVSQLKV
jgi:hypothetical protein